MPTYQVIQSYENLIDLLKEEIDRGDKAIKYQKALVYWNIGQHISRYILQNQKRAGYKERLFHNLSSDLGLGERTLQRAVKFSKEYPIPSARTELDWSHYRALLTVRDKAYRAQLERRAVYQKMTSRQLEQEIKKVQKIEYENIPPQQLDFQSSKRLEHKIPVHRGRIFTYRVIDPPTVTDSKDRIILDCGFNIWREILTEQTIFNPGDTVQLSAGLNELPLVGIQSKKEELFTYKAFVEKIIDGDTLWAHIDCGFFTWTRQKLRLRGIDAAEITTAEGRDVREFVLSALKECPFIIVKTNKSDKYDRYLADIFYLPAEEDPEVVASQGYFLNQALVDRGLAEPWPH